MTFRSPRYQVDCETLVSSLAINVIYVAVRYNGDSRIKHGYSFKTHLPPQSELAEKIRWHVLDLDPRTYTRDKVQFSCKQVVFLTPLFGQLQSIRLSSIKIKNVQFQTMKMQQNYTPCLWCTARERILHPHTSSVNLKLSKRLRRSRLELRENPTADTLDLDVGEVVRLWE